MEERTIKLGLSKAKEWFAKGGELKELALQAFKDEELTSINFPATWEEFCSNNGGCTDYSFKVVAEANAFDALWKLIQLRDEYWRLDNNWKPDFKDGTHKFVIDNYNGELRLEPIIYTNCILAFRKADLRNKFYKNFKNLIEEAKIFL